VALLWVGGRVAVPPPLFLPFSLRSVCQTRGVLPRARSHPAGSRAVGLRYRECGGAQRAAAPATSPTIEESTR